MTPFGVSSIIRPQPWSEVRGPLHELCEHDGYLVAEIGPVTIALPQELKDPLRDLIGHTIAILRTDRDYRWFEVT